MMGDLPWRASLLFPDPRMGKAAAVLCAASAICAANGHELAALAALAAVPITTFAIFFHRMVVKTLEHMGASGHELRRTLSLAEFCSCVYGFFTVRGVSEMLWAAKLRVTASRLRVGDAAPDVKLHPLDAPDLLIKDMIEDWWKKNEQERMNSKMTSAAESSMSSAD